MHSTGHAAGILIIAVLAGDAGAGPQVYVCHQAGQSVYADVPCDAQARLQTVQVLPPGTTANVIADAGPAGESKADVARAARGSRAAAIVTPSAASRARAAREAAGRASCADVKAELKVLRDRLRAGYTAAEGARLGARIAALDRQRQQQGCGF